MLRGTTPCVLECTLRTADANSVIILRPPDLDDSHPLARNLHKRGKLSRVGEGGENSLKCRSKPDSVTPPQGSRSLLVTDYLQRKLSK